MTEGIPPQIKVYPTPVDLARACALDFLAALEKKFRGGKKLTVALSGGSTPALLFQELARHTRRPDWGGVKIFWSDERMVPPDHPESNYGLAHRLWLKTAPIPDVNIFRVPGEIPSGEAAEQYGALIQREVPSNAAPLPRFDWIFLGLGEDGHTASLFPGSASLGIRDRICTAVAHPATGQPRLTFTLPLINQARKVTFLVTGASKSGLVGALLQRQLRPPDCPAAAVLPEKGELVWYLDQAAAGGPHVLVQRTKQSP
jgi:6-phosphogluconolactonase